jgi:hypothetical protein
MKKIFFIILVTVFAVLASCSDEPQIQKTNERQIQAALDTLPPYRWNEITDRRWVYYRSPKMLYPVTFSFFKDSYAVTRNGVTDLYWGKWIDNRTFVSELDSIVVTTNFIECHVKAANPDPTKAPYWAFETRFYSQFFRERNWQ